MLRCGMDGDGESNLDVHVIGASKIFYGKNIKERFD